MVDSSLFAFWANTPEVAYDAVKDFRSCMNVLKQLFTAARSVAELCSGDSGALLLEGVGDAFSTKRRDRL